MQKTALKKEGRRETTPGRLGRKPMFKDELAVVAVLRAESEPLRLKNKTCTLHNLAKEVESHPELFAARLSDTKGTKVGYQFGAIKQAVYRLVREHKIWLSRSGTTE